MATVYLALYKGKGNWQDKIVRFFTRGQYSHCEIVIFKQEFDIGEQRYPTEWWDCYSCSPRDGGVRCKAFSQLSADKWDLIPLSQLTESQVKAYFEQTKGKPYDWRGVLGLFFGLRQNDTEFFCSEWCYNLIFNSESGWRFSPNQLKEIVIKSRT